MTSMTNCMMGMVILYFKGVACWNFQNVMCFCPLRLFYPIKTVQTQGKCPLAVIWVFIVFRMKRIKNNFLNPLKKVLQPLIWFYWNFSILPILSPNHVINAPFISLHTNCHCCYRNTCADPEWGYGVRAPLNNHKKIGSLVNTGLDPL